MKPVFLATDAAAQAKHDHWGTLTWVAGKIPGNSDQIGAAYVTINRGQQNPRHRHNTCEEVLYLIAGTLRHSLGDDVVTLNAGDTLVVPAGTFHNAVNVGDDDAQMLVIYSTAERDFELESDYLERTGQHG